MTTGLHDASVPVFRQMLTSLSGMIDKAAAFAEAKKIEPSVLLNARLAPDMFPFVRQVQIACDFAKGATARLAGVEIPSFADVEVTFAECKDRIQRTLAFVEAQDKAAIDAAEDRPITITIAGQPVTFPGRRYLLGLALPNFYFHTSMAYAILRHNGVELGKRDFIGTPAG